MQERNKLNVFYPQNFEDKIGMTEVRNMLRSHCLSSLGQERVEQMVMLTDVEVIRELQLQIGEMKRLLTEVEDFPDQGYYDLRPTLQRIRIEGTFMEVDEIFSMKRSLEAIEKIISITLSEESPFPALSRLVKLRQIENQGSNLNTKALIRQIDSILDKFGHVKDNASPELQQIRRELAKTEGSISRVLHSILRSAQADGTVANDVAPTMRDGRLVIPVAPALKRKIKGIVHDESATGKTVFIEPQEVVEANNRIRELEADERREVIRILRAFTDNVRPIAPNLIASYEMLADIEFVRAKVKMAEQINALITEQPQIEAEPLIDWTLAIHPLLSRTLARHGAKVVPLDIMLTHDQRILIISGPNAGGKSVCLQTVGLLQYMLQCGLPVSLGENSHMGVFKNIMIDIGDEQSIENELSTYSSHLLNMKQMMRNATPDTLLLIDELGSGTEPQIGGAMAEAMMTRFVRAGAFGVVTTHYQNLKHFAEVTDGVVNGAMLYDRHLMQALFQLQIGQPGSSFAVEIARKTGIPEEVIADAAEIVGRDYINADKWLQDIVRDRRYWQNKRQTIHEREKALQQKIEEYEAKTEALRLQRKDILHQAREEADQLLRDANARIELTIREIKEAQAEREQTRKARARLTIRKEEHIPHKKESKASPTVSSYVRIKGQNAIGLLERIDGEKATVVFGQVRTSVALNRLEAASKPKAEESTSGITFVSRQTQDIMREKSLNFRQDIDVRGMRADEALNAVQHLIDDATQVGVARVRILHGTGTGVLRHVIRQYLDTISDVSDAHDEHVQFGGAGITVVDLNP